MHFVPVCEECAKRVGITPTIYFNLTVSVSGCITDSTLLQVYHSLRKHGTIFTLSRISMFQDSINQSDNEKEEGTGITRTRGLVVYV
jgi:hypothetical protein